jgi:hypothetical protein
VQTEKGEYHMVSNKYQRPAVEIVLFTTDEVFVQTSTEQPIPEVLYDKWGTDIGGIF